MSRIPPYYREDYEFLWGKIKYKNKKVLDIGADVGSTADYFLRKGAKVVIAVEGDREFYHQLKRNAEAIKGITPVFLWIDRPEHYADLIKTHQPDVLKADCEGCEKNLFDIPDKVFSMVSEYIVETHTDTIFHSMKDKCEKNGYEIVNVMVYHRPDLRIVYARRP